jgi:amino acid permease
MADTIPTKQPAQEKDLGLTTEPLTPEYDSDNVEVKPQREAFWTRMGLTTTSFKRRPVGQDALNQTLKPRHLHMIAIGGSIGAGFFVGSGSALNKGGPGALLIDFIIMGIMIFNVGKIQILQSIAIRNITDEYSLCSW